MGPASGIALFFIIWWTALFAVLPFSLKRDEHGMPDDPKLKRKFLLTTVLSAVLWVCVYLVVQADLIDFRAIAVEMSRKQASAAELSVCDFLPEHRPSADVEYKGDSDVPADLNPLGAAAVVPVVKIPVTLDLAQKFQLTLPQGVELKPDVAMLEVHPGGRVTYNGQDLSAQAADLCASGQADEEAVSSPAEEDTPMTIDE